MDINNFFNPRTVAVIGASNDKNKVGFAVMSNLLAGSSRKIFPVSISEKEILGVPTVTSVRDIAEHVDLAIIAVRADIVPQILSDCAEKNILSVIIISAGFKEAGEQGAMLEKQIADMAREKGIAVLGPNCLGTLCTQTQFNSSFAPGNPPTGNIAFLSQSGALGTALLDMAVSEGVGFSKFISLGNEAHLTEMEFLKFLADDTDTHAILMYIEKLSNGAGFLELARDITRTKPVIVLKAGRSTQGAKAVSSHTGSLAPDDAVFSAACTQAGVITVNSIREFFNMAKLFRIGVMKPLQRICILTNGGGPSVVATDLVDMSRSLSLAVISDDAKEALRKVLPPMAAVGNPIDIIGDALSDRFENALKIVVEEKDTDAIVLLVTPQMMTEMQKTAELVARYSSQKPIIPVFLGGPHVVPALVYLAQNKLVNFTFPSDAISALDSLALGLPKLVSKMPLDTKVARTVLDTTQLKMLSFEKMYELLAEYDIPLSGVFVKNMFELGPVLKKLKFENFVMKAESPDIVHKTDAGAVALNITTADEAEKFWREVKVKNPTARIEGMLIQPTAEGREVIIGMKRDATFGPTILFGLGGIFAETIKDTALRVAPVSVDDARKMMTDIKGAKILSGLRGEKPVDFDSLAEIISNLSRLALDHPEIKEIDLNPVMATPLGATIVDVRIMV